MNILNVLKSELVDRIFNKHTPVGIVSILVGIILTNAGYSEKSIELAMSYNWDFVERALKEWHTGIEISAIFFTALGGFYLIRVDSEKRRLRQIERAVIESQAKTQIAEDEVKQNQAKLQSIELQIATLDKTKELEDKLKLYGMESNKTEPQDKQKPHWLKAIMKLNLFIWMLFLILSGNSYAVVTSFEGKVTKVVDGDTLYINGDIKVRMACVDAYESSNNKHLNSQSNKLGKSKNEILQLGQEQKKMLQQYEGKFVKIFYDTNNKLDLYNRLLGVVIYEQDGSFDVLNVGLKYYNNTFLCKQFLLD